VAKKPGIRLRNSRVRNRRGLVSAKLYDATDKVDPADVTLAVIPDVVEDYEWSIGPTGENQVIESQSLHGRVGVISPQSRFRIALSRLVRKTVNRISIATRRRSSGKSELICRLHAKRTLRKAIYEQDWPARVPGLNNVELNASAASDPGVSSSFHLAAADLRASPPTQPKLIAYMCLFRPTTESPTLFVPPFRSWIFQSAGACRPIVH
jgi:hypothetical protein